ncbi:von Willebrand factor A domain-containing protein 5A-like [Acomys russatus]|uniref:von Willebrand factor A domain-containing protein 5A-like n=1 Tax=Acomys russatus TaxID=60746 RepID=UPI0021E2DA73|nr:von Willebrand factor A domain-containing protein 5A-like [Acomys russatus]
MKRHCGLVTKKEYRVPLRYISVTLSINEFVAGATATFYYENEEQAQLEATFVFPVDEDTAVYSFEALVDGKKIMAELQEKTKAHSNYEDALKQGYQAYLLEEDDYSRDIFACHLGRLQPGAKVAVTLRYVQELPLEADGALRYLLPAILNPRHQLSEESASSYLNIKEPLFPVEGPSYTLSIVATITSQHGIERVQSNCSLSPIQYLTDDKTSAQVSLAEGHKFDRDVELLIYYTEVRSPTVAVEMGMPDRKPDSLMGAPSAMVSFYPAMPEVEASSVCGEFVFLVDCSISMQSPLNNQNKSELRIEAAKETLLLLIKSLPVGCYFNIYGFGSSYEKLFPESVKYTQESMEEAVERVKDLEAELGDTEILTPLCNIYKAPSIPGHPLQLFVFTDGEVTDTFSVIQEVKLNSKKHRCFSFGIGEGASTSLIKSIARVSGGSAEFITGKDMMKTKALRSLKFALQSAVEDISLTWDLPPGLSANMLSPKETAIFRGQRLIIYAQLTGFMPLMESSGKICLKYTIQGKSIENRVTFSLQPKTNDSFTIHRLAAKSLIQIKDLGPSKTPEREKEDVVNISIQSGVLSSFTAFITIMKGLNQPVQCSAVHRLIPRPVAFDTGIALPQIITPNYKPRFRLRPARYVTNFQDHIDYEKQSSVLQKKPRVFKLIPVTDSSTRKNNLQNDHKAIGENVAGKLISLQNANGSWKLDEDLAMILGTNLEDIKAANPAKHEDPSAWAAVLVGLWLHANAKDFTGHFLKKRVMAWLHNHGGSSIPMLVQAANGLLKVSVNPDALGF